MMQVNSVEKEAVNLSQATLPPVVEANRRIEENYSWALKRIERLYYQLKIPSHMREDVKAQALFSYTVAANRFREGGAASFRTYASHYIRGAFLEELRKSKRRNCEISARKPSGFDKSDAHSTIDRQRNGERSTTLNYFKAAGKVGVRAADDGFNSDAFIRQVRGDDVLEQKKLKEALIKAICALPERERYVIDSYYYQGLSMREIGTEMGIKISWVSRIHKRALRRLRDSL